MSDPVGRPLLSVIVPSYNQGRYLRDCIESVLAQNYQPFEIIVVDGASKDETLEVLKSYAHLPQLRWLSEPDSGPADAVNKGLRMARGELASIQSADDWYLPGAFDRVVKEFADPGVGLVYGEVVCVNAAGVRRSQTRWPAHSNALCIALGVCIPQSSAFFRCALGQALGGWRGEYYTCDWDFWLRMMFKTQARKVDEVLSAWRMYPDQRTGRRRKVYESFVRMLEDSPEVRDGGAAVQRGARAGRHLISIGFAGGGSMANLYHLAAATLIFPAVWKYVPRKSKLIPGLLPLRSWWRRKGSSK